MDHLETLRELTEALNLKEEENEELTRYLLQFLELTPDLVVIATFDPPKFVKASEACQELLGWTADELCSRPFIDFVHPDDIGATEKEIERLRDEGHTTFRFQNRYLHKDGHYVTLDWSAKFNGDNSFAIARPV